MSFSNPLPPPQPAPDHELAKEILQLLLLPKTEAFRVLKHVRSLRRFGYDDDVVKVFVVQMFHEKESSVLL